jgi:hypothetical protein
MIERKVTELDRREASKLEFDNWQAENPEKWVEMVKKVVDSDPEFQKLIYENLSVFTERLAAMQAVLDRRTAEAKRILDLFERGDFSALYHMEPVSGVLLVEVCAHLDRKSQRQAINMLNSGKAKHAADAMHSKPGGSREKKERIREIWATGKYTSRDICAEQECANLDMSFSVARKALRNTPNPLSRC